jgi:Copper binding periplasmic protein CusF
MNPRLIVSLVAVLQIWAGHFPAMAQRPIQFPLPTQSTRYRVLGTVLSLRPDNRELVLDADSVPGYMPAMAMPFSVRDTSVFGQVRPGDNISADIVVVAGSSWLENVTVQGEAPIVTSGPMVDTSAMARRDSGRPPKDSIGFKPPSVDSVLRPNTMRDSTTLRYPPR